MNQEELQTQAENKKKRKTKTKTTNAFNGLLHFLQHLCFVAAAVLLVIVLLGAYVTVDTRNGKKLQKIYPEASETVYEDSETFNELLGNSVSEIICYGAIRAQMETDGKYDPKKEIDVTAFANRHTGLEEEYITARYYLEDLIQWSAYGFEHEEVYMNGEEVDRFLSRMRTVTTVDFSKGSGGKLGYLNSDMESVTRVEDISGNIISTSDPMRSDTTATVLNNRYYTVDGKKIENHVFSWDEYYELCNHVRKAGEDLHTNYEEYQKYQEYYADDNTNIVYYIFRTIGENTEVYSNQGLVATSFSAMEKQLKNTCDKYLIYDQKNMMYETNTNVEEDTVRYVLNGYAYAYPEDTQIMIGVKTDYPVTDAFAQAKGGYGNYAPNFWQYLTAAIICGVLYLFFLFVLTMREGVVKKKSGETVICLKREDEVPTEIMLLLAVVVFGVLTGLCLVLSRIDGIRTLSGKSATLVLTGILALLVSLAISFFFYSFVRRMKAHVLWKNSLLRRLSDAGKKSAVYLYRNSSMVVRVWIPFIAFVLLHIVVGFIIFTSKRDLFVMLGILVLFVADGLIGLMLYRSAQGRQRILQGIQKINDGETDHVIDKNGLYGDNLVLGDAVNNIGEGIREAVATSMKDERLKADLITNVSHDIKTPLTSIINYVDLIKRENVENPKVKEYIEVLDAKSQRLKQLTDDLVEASKISSGNIILQWEKINLVELLNQTIGEFSEKFEEKMLTPVFRTGKNSVYIEADSRRIWRVIENLLHNIFKYALPGTRVYLDLRESDAKDGKKQVALSIMNISASPIKVNTDELTERFIRGDESRTTEGSGLGLSIAKNLTEAQKGKFEIAVDGDLFKVILTFPQYEEK